MNECMKACGEQISDAQEDPSQPTGLNLSCYWQLIIRTRFTCFGVAMLHAKMAKATPQLHPWVWLICPSPPIPLLSPTPMCTQVHLFDVTEVTEDCKFRTSSSVCSFCHTVLSAYESHNKMFNLCISSASVALQQSIGAFSF